METINNIKLHLRYGGNMRILVIMATVLALVGCATTMKETATAVDDLSYIFPNDEVIHEADMTVDNAKWLFSTDEYSGWGY